MIKKTYDKKYNFAEIFDTKTGFSVRTGIIENGVDTNVDPFMRSFPALLDVGIMGHCKNAKYCTVGCYQGKKVQPNMTFENFRSIIDQAVVGGTFEVALGGFGSPNEHPDFVKIVQYAHDSNIVPNYTTSGIELTDEEIEATRKYCGAVAVSWYGKDYTTDSIKRFIDGGCKTNIHYVLGNDSIDEAIERLENNDFPEGVNAVVFLVYKPVGCVKQDNVLKTNDPRVARFYELVDKGNFNFKVGLDACNMPGVVNFSKNINPMSTSPCDGGSFSTYITPDMVMLSCSFDSTTRNYGADIKTMTMQEAWNSEAFERFRNYHRNSCPTCPAQNECRGGCPITPEINLCDKIEKELV